MAKFDIDPVVAGVASIISAGLIPAVLHAIYEDIPDLAATEPPFAFFEYRGGSQERVTFEPNGGLSYKRRIFNIDIVCPVALAQHVVSADRAIKGIVGPMYRLMEQHTTLDGLVDDALIVRDNPQPLILGGSMAPIVFVSVVFTLQVIKIP